MKSILKQISEIKNENPNIGPNALAREIGCNRSTVYYHLYPRYKEKGRENSKKFWTKRKKWLVESMGGKCNKCGYDRYYGALDLHHLDGKDFSFGKNLCKKSEEELIEEAKKCVILCANCHRELHGGFNLFN